MASLLERAYNPDVLTCLANLSNDEVFTPPDIANKMLDMLPQELFESKTTTFLDPACKSGVFLREIAKRLLKAQLPGYEEAVEIIEEKKLRGIPLDKTNEFFEKQLQETVDHIFHNQLYGIAITELTSLLSRRSVYCSKYANSEFSVSKFDNIEGNIRFKRTEHGWDKSGKCVFCGTTKNKLDRGEDFESHAYEWIHTLKPEEIFDMHFDVVISNPPYQLDDGGNGASAKPIYHLFVEQAKKLNPHYLSMIIPARWYSGGKGLDDFRDKMLSDEHLVRIVDYTNSADCFPGVDVAGGICYFLWDRDKSGECLFTNYSNGTETTVMKRLNEFPTLIRYPIAASIVQKVQSKGEETLSSFVPSRKPFGLATTVRPEASGDLLLRNKDGIGKFPSSKIGVGNDIIDKWKVMISRLSAEHAGQPDKDGKFKVLSTTEILPPKTICTETYLIAGSFDTEAEAKNYFNYLKGKFARFLVAQIAMTQQITKFTFSFVPIQDFSKPWTDEELYAKYGLTDDEIAFIESMIKPMDLSTGDES